MNESDTYLTIKAFSQGTYREKGSRFIALAYPVSSADEIKAILEKNRKDFHDARHHCFAYILGQKREVWRINDDGEPSGTAGKPIMGQINSSGLTNILILVVRYFGGRLLGVSGLINAYRSAAASAIANAEIIERTLHDFFELEFPYQSINDIMKVIKDEGITQWDQKFDEICRMTISFRKSSRERILNLFSRIADLKHTYSHTL